MNKDFIEKEIKFELDFFNYIAKTENFEIVCFPYDVIDGHKLTEEEINTITLDCKRRNIILLYRITINSKIALIYTQYMDVIGMIPEKDIEGFYC